METVIIITALAFAVINGFHDGCNVMATIISSRSMAPKKALLFACLFEFIGAVAFGTAVAMTVGQDVLSSALFGLPAGQFQTILISALAAGIAWNLLTWFFGMPSSSSHALIGGLVGAGLAAFGLDAVNWQPLLRRVLIPLLVAPPLAFVGAFLLMKLTIGFFRNYPPGIAVFFKKVQFFSMAFLAAGHGSNDAQKSMGVIALALMAGGAATLRIPPWTVLACALAISVGLSFGGWRIIRTLGKDISKMTPLHSFNSQIASGLIIFFASVLGFPVSMTQIVASTVMGAGAGNRIKSVRWHVARNIVSAWLVTIPATALIAAVMVIIIKLAR